MARDEDDPELQAAILESLGTTRGGQYLFARTKQLADKLLMW